MLATHFHTDDTSCPKSADGPYSHQANELHGASETIIETSRNTDEDDSSGKSVRGSYAKSAITNDGDFKIRAQLDEAEDLFEKVRFSICFGTCISFSTHVRKRSKGTLQLPVSRAVSPLE
ncbi:hypothetical protein BaRGS_00003585 [Batillaria attramentaria]|uniref:Uncharacterized protein n=1 Tax=Batillaria attramentaria TaxID=370345 RepID=A0ABD0LZS0_9CAEN